MALGDIIQAPAPATTNSAASITVNFALTPTEGNLMIASHMTGAANSTISTSGWTEAVPITNGTESDESAIYWKIAGASEPTGVTCAGGTDEHILFILEVEGPWEATPIDKAEAEARQASGTSYVMSPAGDTSQADEFAAVLLYTRDASNGGNVSWNNSFVERADTNTSYKTMAVATKVLTTVQTVSVTASYTASSVAMGGMVTFKKSAATSDGALSVSAASSNTAVGSATATGDFYAISNASILSEGRATASSPANITATSDAQFTGEGTTLVQAEFDFTSTADAGFAGQSNADGILDITSSSVLSGEGSSQGESAFSIQATSNMIVVGSASADGVFASNAISALSSEGAATAESALNVSSTGSVEWIGEVSAEGAGDLSITSFSEATFASQSTIDSAVNIEAVSDAEWISDTAGIPSPAPTSPAGGGAFGWSKKRKWKEFLRRDDEDLLRLLAIALPHIIAEYRRSS